MNKLFSEIEYTKAKREDLLLLECELCKVHFYKTKGSICVANKASILNPTRLSYCGTKCRNLHMKKRVLCKCKHCEKDISKVVKSIKKNVFCSQSCAASYNNTHKTHGTRVSKLEKWIKEQLTILYPDLEIHYNRKDAINSELDIYIPSLKLAFELNGIYHYEPIHGNDLLTKIINNDNRKFQACIESGISLCIIDTSSQTYVKPSTSEKFLTIIKNIINPLYSLNL